MTVVRIYTCQSGALHKIVMYNPDVVWCCMVLYGDVLGSDLIHWYVLKEDIANKL